MEKRKTIAAVLGEDIIRLLTSIKMYDSLLEGKLLCSKCHKKLEEHNLTVVIPKAKNQFEFICNDPCCFGSFVESGASK
jgi:hypothetical protein